MIIRFVFCFLFLLLQNQFLFAQGSSLDKSTDESTLNKFAFDVFVAITKNNYEAFSIYTVKKEDYPELNAKQIFKDENSRKNALKNADSLITKHQNTIKSKFEKIQKNAYNAGIKWTDCQYGGYRIINKVPLKNSTKYDISIQFTYKGIGNYEIFLNDCYQLKKGWIIWKSIGGPR